MRVTCSINNEEQVFDIEDHDDLKILLEAIETEVRIRHPEVNKNCNLVLAITDGVLNALADDCEQIDLGELADAKP